MRVAVAMLNRGRGSGVVARQHVAALLARGHRVTLLHPQMDGGVSGAVNRDVRLHSDVLPVHEYLPTGGTLQRQVAAMPAAEAFAYVSDYEKALWDASGEADLIIGHHANISAVAAARVAAGRRIPYVLFVHGTGIEPIHHGGYAPSVRAAVDAAVRGAAGIIVTTEYVRDHLVRPIVPVPVDRFLVLPCGVDIEVLRPGDGLEARRRFDLPDTYVLCPGAITWLKGPHNVVAASERYAHLAPTIFIGDGQLRPQLEPILGERGRFLGYVSEREKAALMEGATILTAAPEKREHFGIIYVEGLATGAVPVAYGGGGVDTVVTPDVGVLTDRDPDALGTAVEELLARRDRLRAMAQAGRERAEALFDERVLGARLVTWLEEIAASNSVVGASAVSEIAG